MLKYISYVVTNLRHSRTLSAQEVSNDYDRPDPYREAEEARALVDVDHRRTTCLYGDTGAVVDHQQHTHSGRRKRRVLMRWWSVDHHPYEPK